MTDQELLANWPLNPCSICGTAMEPLNDQITPSPDGQHILLFCPGCNAIGMASRTTLEAQAATEKTTTDLSALNPDDLPEDQKAALFELASLWAQLVQSGIDPRRLRVTLTR